LAGHLLTWVIVITAPGRILMGYTGPAVIALDAGVRDLLELQSPEESK